MNIVGSEYCGNVPLLLFESLNVLPEPTNQADPNAVVVTAMRNGTQVKIGYIARDNKLQRMVKDYYIEGGLVYAFVDDMQNYTMSMAFYKQSKFKKCPDCGYNNPIEGEFCSKCGAKL